jgi:integrase
MSQLLARDWSDVDLRLGMIVCRNGKSAQERAGREQPMASWLVEEMSRWQEQRGAVLGSDKTPTAVPLVMRRLWAKTRAPEAVYRQRPDHAFRIGLISGLTALRAPPDAIEYYVGHALPSTRRAYLDPSTIGLGEVARLIPPIEWGVVQIPFSRSSRGKRVVGGPRM